MADVKSIEIRNTNDFSDYLELLLARTESTDLEFKSANWEDTARTELRERKVSLLPEC